MLQPALSTLGNLPLELSDLLLILQTLFLRLLLGLQEPPLEL
jgi:hypothetical protein